jgi:hypothetical protein
LITKEMAETFVENLVCAACDADVRPQALFCYNCGGSVAPKIESSDKNGKPKNVDLFIDKISEDKNVTIEPIITEIPVATIVNEETSKKSFPKANTQEKAELKSAASLPRKSRIIQPKRVEISWEERENTPNILFIVVALSLTLFAIGVLFLALQFK